MRNPPVQPPSTWFLLWIVGCCCSLVLLFFTGCNDKQAIVPQKNIITQISLMDKNSEGFILPSAMYVDFKRKAWLYSDWYVYPNPPGSNYLKIWCSGDGEYYIVVHGKITFQQNDVFKSSSKVTELLFSDEELAKAQKRQRQHKDNG